MIKFSLNDMSGITSLDKDLSNSKGSRTGSDSPAIEPTLLSVEQLNKQIRQIIEGEFPLVWLKAEISNFKAHSSGHFYLSLKDAKSQIRAVMFRGHNSHLKFRPGDGMEVIVRGRVTVYEPRGEYQITIETMEPVGAGALQKAFEQLKTKLKTEGLFDVKRKRPLPRIPKHIALVTSPTGAAIQDMLNVLRRRNPLVRITLVPTVVQGETAAPLIVAAMKTAWSLPDVDVIIVGRGGGSIEDMWCFNDETLARTVAKSPVPVISAVGHEIDFTICDFVADLRAPTPSAAAELVTTGRDELIGNIQSLEKLLLSHFHKALSSWKHRVVLNAKRLVDPKRRLQDLMQRNDDFMLRLSRAQTNHLKGLRNETRVLAARLPTPQHILDLRRKEIGNFKTRLTQSFRHLFDTRRSEFREAVALLNTLSPLSTVERGYSITRKGGKVVSDIKQVKAGDKIEIIVHRGLISADVTSAKTGNDFKID